MFSMFEDVNTRSFDVYVGDPDGCFGDLLSSGSGDSLDASDRMKPILREIAVQLENDELLYISSSSQLLPSFEPSITHHSEGGLFKEGSQCGTRNNFTTVCD